MTVPIVDPQVLATELAIAIKHVHEGKFVRVVDTDAVYAFVRMHLADSGIYSMPVGSQPLHLITHHQYLTETRSVLDAAIFDSARKQREQMKET